MKLTIKLLALFFGVLMLANVANAASPREQLKQMVEQLQENPTDNALREKIIKLAQQLKPAPAVPEEARRYLARGIAAFEIAKSSEDFKLALPEFQNAANAAPWWPDTYFNLAKVQEKTGDFKGAIASYGLYLIADPNAKDAEAIRTQSYKLDFMAEQKGKEEERNEQQRRIQDFITNLTTGIWDKFNCEMSPPHSCGHGVCNGCTAGESGNTQNIHWGGSARFGKVPNSENAIAHGLYASLAPSDSLSESGQIIGHVRGSSLNEIDWECVRNFDGRRSPVKYKEFKNGGNILIFSCDYDGNKSKRNSWILYQRE